MVTKVYLVRHAEAMGNIENKFQGHLDADISEKGRLQLNLLSERFKDVEIEKIYSSPLIRTRETANAVNRYHNLPIILKKGLIEINGGDFEGKTWDKLPVLFPDEYDKWQHCLHEFSAPNGESTQQVYDRMRKTVSEIIAESKGSSIAIISHGFALKTFLCSANNHSVDYIREIGWSDNTAVSLIEFDDNFTPSIIFQNDNSHLDENTSTLAHQTWWKSDDEGEE